MKTPETHSGTYDVLYEKWRGANTAKTTFEEAIKQGFYVLSYTKTTSGYLINGVSADFGYEFTLNNGAFSGIKKILVDETAENPIQDYLDAVLANIYHTGYINTPSASAYSLPATETGLRIIPAEGIEAIKISELAGYIEKIDGSIRQHEDDYKRKVAEIVERGNQFL